MKAEPEQDFDTFYGATYRRLLAQVFVVTGNLHEAEDCLQEAYARAWQRWGRLSEEHGNPEAWVRVAATRHAVSSWRKAINRLTAHRRASPPTEVSGMTPDHLALVDALRQISVDQRLAIVLYHYAGLSIDEIAAQTQSRSSTVKARLARGRRALAPHLTEYGDAPEGADLLGPAPAQPHLASGETEIRYV